MTTVMNPPATGPSAHGVAESKGLFDGPILRQALKDSLLKMDPRIQVKNPVMFTVLVGSVITLIEAFAHPSTFTWSITVWLFLTVLFANFAEAMAEGRGKAQADTLRKMRSEAEARRLRSDGSEELVPRTRRCAVAAPQPLSASFATCPLGPCHDLRPWLRRSSRRAR